MCRGGTSDNSFGSSQEVRVSFQLIHRRVLLTNPLPPTSHTYIYSCSGGKPSKYGFTEKIIDGMRVEIHSIVVRFHDPTFRAELEMADIVIQSTTPQWGIAQSLAQTRSVEDGVCRKLDVITQISYNYGITYNCASARQR